MLRHIAGQFLKAVKALLHGGFEGLVSFRFDGKLELVIESVACKSPFMDGHGEWTSLDLDHRFQSVRARLGFYDFTGFDLATSLGGFQVCRKGFGKVGIIEFARFRGHYQHVVRPNAFWQAVGIEQGSFIWCE